MSILEDAREIAARSAPEQTGPKGGLLRRFGFRLLFCYVALYLLSLFAEGLWEPLVTWTGQSLFHADIVQEFTGSGDTAYSYVLALCCAALALLTAVIWTPFDRKRKADARLAEWMRVAVRFGLAMQMLSYGIMKIIPVQFSTPSLNALTEPLGDHSPMGLLWEFMGTSLVYTVFAGSVEAVGGLLLLSRRTTLLGALVSIAAMGNVVALNFCYDVPVKLMSSHLLAMAVLLAAPDVGRLMNVLLWNRPAPPAVLRPHSVRRWVNWTLLGVKVVLFGGWVTLFGFSTVSSRQTFADTGPKPPLYGVWNADEPAQAGLPEADRWRQAVFEFPGVVVVQLADGTYHGYRVFVNRKRGTIRLTTPKEKLGTSRLSYTDVRPGQILLQGEFDGHPLRATLTQIPPREPPLLSRGFHWISPAPFNR